MNPALNRYVTLAKAVVQGYNEDRLAIFAGYVAFAGILSLFPFVIFLVALAGFFGAKWLKGQSHWPIWLGVSRNSLSSRRITPSRWRISAGSRLRQAWRKPRSRL